MITVREISKITNMNTSQVKNRIQKLDLETYKLDERKTAPLHISHDGLRKIMANEELEVIGPKVMVIASEKGGIGKTFLSINIAAMATKKGQRVCVIDIDPESCATNSLMDDSFELDFSYQTIYEAFSYDLSLDEITIPSKYDGLDFIPCKPKARDVERLTADKHPMELLPKKIEALKEKYDLILIDIPPTFTRIIGSAYLSADVVIQPCLPNMYSIESVDLTILDIKTMAEEFRLNDDEIPQMYVLKNKFKTNEIASKESNILINERFASQVLPFYISNLTDCDKLTNDGLTVIDIKTNATSQIKELYDFFFNIKKRGEGQ